MISQDGFIIAAGGCVVKFLLVFWRYDPYSFLQYHWSLDFKRAGTVFMAIAFPILLLVELLGYLSYHLYLFYDIMSLMFHQLLLALTF